MKKIFLFLIMIFCFNQVFSFIIPSGTNYTLDNLNSTFILNEDVEMLGLIQNDDEVEFIDIVDTSLTLLEGNNYRFSQPNTIFYYPDDVDLYNLEEPIYSSTEDIVSENNVVIQAGSEFELINLNSTIIFDEEVKVCSYVKNADEFELIYIIDTSISLLKKDNWRFTEENKIIHYPSDVDLYNLETPLYTITDDCQSTNTTTGDTSSTIDERPEIVLTNIENGDIIDSVLYTVYFEVNSPINALMDLKITDDVNNIVTQTYTNVPSGTYRINLDGLVNGTYYYSIKAEDTEGNVKVKSFYFIVELADNTNIEDNNEPTPVTETNSSIKPIIEVISPQQNEKEKGEIYTKTSVDENNNTLEELDARAKIIFYIEDDGTFDFKVKDLDGNIYFEKETQTTGNFYFYMDNLSLEKQYQFFIETTDNDNNKVISKAINFEFDYMKDFQKIYQEKKIISSIPIELKKYLEQTNN